MDRGERLRGVLGSDSSGKDDADATEGGDVHSAESPVGGLAGSPVDPRGVGIDEDRIGLEVARRGEVQDGVRPRGDADGLGEGEAPAGELMTIGRVLVAVELYEVEEAAL